VLLLPLPPWSMPGWGALLQLVQQQVQEVEMGVEVDTWEGRGHS
jgi:hypothetical protein